MLWHFYQVLRYSTFSLVICQLSPSLNQVFSAYCLNFLYWSQHWNILFPFNLFLNSCLFTVSTHSYCWFVRLPARFYVCAVRLYFDSHIAASYFLFPATLAQSWRIWSCKILPYSDFWCAVMTTVQVLLCGSCILSERNPTTTFGLSNFQNFWKGANVFHNRLSAP